MTMLRWLQHAVGVWSCRNFPRGEPVDPLLGLGEEVGELMHAFLKCKQGIRGTSEEHRAAMIDAVGDIMIYLADFCERNNIDLQSAVETTWDRVSRRDWQLDRKNGGEI